MDKLIEKLDLFLWLSCFPSSVNSVYFIYVLRNKRKTEIGWLLADICKGIYLVLVSCV